MIAKNPIVLSFPHISLGGETGCDGRGDASDDTSQSSAIRTRFWRSSNRDAKCVSTIEALYWFLRLRGERLGESDAATAYDDLLLLFAHQHAIVRDAMRTRLERRRLRDAQSEVTDVVAVGK